MVDVNGRGSGEASGLGLSPVDRTVGLLLHEQVAASIRRAIADGEAKPGERIPQARDLAVVLGVNTNTVLRAIRLLRDEGILEAGRGKATTVAGTPERSAVVGRVNELLSFAARQGYGRADVIALIRQLPG